MKKKLAALLRRWASKLSPEIILPPPVIRETRHDVKRFQGKAHYSRRELQDIEQEPDLAPVIDMDKRRRLLDDIALEMYQAGAKNSTQSRNGPRIVTTF